MGFKGAVFIFQIYFFHPTFLSFDPPPHFFPLTHTPLFCPPPTHSHTPPPFRYITMDIQP